MKNRKEINIFSTSFLDLLSGALGAVLILFIIIPKLTSAQMDALEEIERLNVQAEELAELIEQARTAIPVELYEQIQAQIEALHDRLQELREAVVELQRRLDDCEEERARLHREIEELRQELERQRQEIEHSRRQSQEIEQLREELEQTRRELREAQQQAQAQERQRDGLPSNFSEMGDVQAFIMWEEHVDVDIYVENLDNGEQLGHPGSGLPNEQSWGMLSDDINHLRLRGDGVRYFEIFYQPRPVPGRYKIWFHIFQNEDGTHWNGRPATVRGFIVMFAGEPNEIRINYRSVTLTSAFDDHVIGTLVVTEDNIMLVE